MQQMCHQIRTGGDMTFEDIYYVVPWTCHFLDLNQDPDANQPSDPRLFKSHQIASAVNRPLQILFSAEYIVSSMANNADTSSRFETLKRLLSHSTAFSERSGCQHFFLSNRKICLFQILPDEVDIDSFAQKILVRGTDFPPLLDYFVEYWKCAHLTDMILILK